MLVATKQPFANMDEFVVPVRLVNQVVGDNLRVSLWQRQRLAYTARAQTLQQQPKRSNRKDNDLVHFETLPTTLKQWNSSESAMQFSRVLAIIPNFIIAVTAICTQVKDLPVLLPRFELFKFFE